MRECVHGVTYDWDLGVGKWLLANDNIVVASDLGFIDLKYVKKY